MDEQTQNLTDHLSELRKRLIYSLYGLIVAFSICYYYSEHIFNFIRKPIEPFLQNSALVFTGVMDKFVAHIKVSGMAAVAITCPFWLYQIWKFIEPGLYKNEKKYAASFILAGTLLFVSGGLFAYYLVFPIAFEFLMHFGGTTDQPLITIDSYMSFFIFSSFIFGITFELPLVLVILALMGIIDGKFLKQNRRYAAVLLAIAAAIITPPDALSMILVLGPMLILYEASVLIVSRITK